MTALETVRELHVLYGIAATNELTETEPAIYSVYGKMIWAIHWAILAITAGDDPATEIRRLAGSLNHRANESDDERVAALYGSWAQNIKSIT